VIYDEQPPFPPSSHPASVFEESPVPVIEGSLMRGQTCEKTEELKDGVPEKKSTLNENPSDKKQHSFLQKNVNKRDPPSSHGQRDRKNLFRVENGVTQRGRSASPRKPASRHAEGRSDRLPSPLPTDPKRRPRDRSLSPRRGDSKGQMGTRAGSGQDGCGRSRGRSSSPKKQQKTEGSKGRSSESESQRGGGRARDGAEQISEGREESGVVQKDTKQSQSGKNRTRSPEKKSKRMDEKSLPSKKTSTAASRVLPDREKGKKAALGETSSSKEKPGDNARISDKKLKQDPEERTVLNKTQAPRGKEQEAADRTRESGGFQPESASPVKKTPITPGPWKVPSANKAAGTTGVAEKRL